MLRNRLYYTLKPLLPWPVRMGIRRWFATRSRRTMSGLWPIKSGSERPPAGWPGWPEGKRFALVLSHDIEAGPGLDNVRRLAELEMELGFRSSFNFVPEGNYATPEELRCWLTSNGFEVGVHDLHHDGKLYTSRDGFNKHAGRINSYLEEWGAVGFRSAYMLHNLEWIHELNIEYDASSFDTDPFEPQPDGQSTIFPFWVSAPSLSSKAPSQLPAFNSHRPGYVELPYTLPQDSTLFLLLREQTPEIWINKLDWVARHGGMVLVNVHPDYVQFADDPPSPRTFPADHYIQLLKHVQARYSGQFWQGLPRDIAAYWKQTMLKKPAAAVEPNNAHAQLK